MARDIAVTLGYKEPHKAVAAHCKKAKSLISLAGVIHPVHTNQQLSEFEHNTKFINRSDIARLIVRSNLPAAEAFESWLFDEVFPSIVDTGGYIMAKPEETPEEITVDCVNYMARALLVAQDTNVFGEKICAGIDRLAAQEPPPPYGPCDWFSFTNASQLHPEISPEIR